MKPRFKLLLALPLALVLTATLALPAAAGDLAGVTLADSETVGDQTLVLNGMGLRKKAFIKVYVGGLYLAGKETAADKILAADDPRRMVMGFTFGVSAKKMCGAWDEGLENNTPNASAQLRKKFETLCGFMDDLEKGDRMVSTYVPGTGTEISIGGASKGTIEGKDFADALFACWIGPEPPSKAFKAGLLGG